MDTLNTSGQQIVNVDDKLALIKAEMPQTYASIRLWADLVGTKAYEQVRRGLRGEYRCFWAYEAGHVMGESWHPDFATESLLRIERLGVTHVDVRVGFGAPA